MSKRLHIEATGLSYKRATELIKSAKKREKVWLDHWNEELQRNAPLYEDNHRLRSENQSLKIDNNRLRDQVVALQLRLDTIGAQIRPVLEGDDEQPTA